MKIMNRFACSVAAALTLTSAGAVGAVETLSIGWTEADTEDNAYALAARYFVEELEKIAPGEFDAEFHPNHELGDETQMLQQMQLGSLDAGVITATQVANIEPAFQLNDLPFLYDSNEEAHAVLDGEVGQELLSRLTEKGIVGLGFTEAGFRNVINNVRPIHQTSDLNGVKLRMQPSDIFISTFDALGANPVPMEWSDVFTAVQQGTVDGLEIPVAGIYTNKFAEVTDYLSLTQHAYNAQALLLSKQFFDALSPELQDAVRTAADRAIKRQRSTMASMKDELLQKLGEAGMSINEVDDLQAFRDAVQPVYEEYRGRIGPELVDKAVEQTRD